MEKEIEIPFGAFPFGAFDAELCGWTYTIPEGCEAEIKDGKVVVRKVESEDDKTRYVVEKEPTLKEWFDNIREIAKAFNAGKSEIKSNDGEWEYIFTVRRLKK